MYTCFISYNVYFMIAGNMWNLFDLILQSKDNHIDVCVCDVILSVMYENSLFLHLPSVLFFHLFKSTFRSIKALPNTKENI